MNIHGRRIISLTYKNITLTHFILKRGQSLVGVRREKKKKKKKKKKRKEKHTHRERQRENTTLTPNFIEHSQDFNPKIVAPKIYLCIYTMLCYLQGPT